MLLLASPAGAGVCQLNCRYCMPASVRGFDMNQPAHRMDCCFWRDRRERSRAILSLLLPPAARACHRSESEAGQRQGCPWRGRRRDGRRCATDGGSLAPSHEGLAECTLSGGSFFHVQDCPCSVDIDERNLDPGSFLEHREIAAQFEIGR
jgi:hypothetical protein